MNFQTQWKRHKQQHEVNTQPSKTVPDQTMSVAEIMRRYAQGLPISGQKVPIYEGEDSGVPDNWDKMDISEQHAYMEANAERIREMQQDLSDQKNKRGRYKPKDKIDQKPQENQQPAPSAGPKETPKGND